jgi:peptidyl-prolyl cis-trans isomerase C
MSSAINSQGGYNRRSMPRKTPLLNLILLWLATIFITACGDGTPPPTPATITDSPQPSPTVTETAIPPSPTPIPLAARVNGETIPLAEFEAELARYLEVTPAAGEEQEADAKQRVLADMIDQILLAQGAREAGYLFSDGDLQERLEGLRQASGGAENLERWMETQGYSAETFLKALERSILGAWMRDQIIGAIPEGVEQVHARQIRVDSAERADEVWRQLQAGRDFATLAGELDPLGRGDLGWFPRGVLLDPKLEEAAFTLQPEEYSEVIETRLGFHIMQVIEKDPSRPLDPYAMLVWQDKALEDWLASTRNESDIEITLPDS